MNRTVGFFLAAMLVSLPATARADTASVNQAIDRLLGDHRIFATSIEAFRHAVAAGDKEDVAAFVRYPISLEVDGHKRRVTTSNYFVRHYDAIMTPDIVAAVKNQGYGDLFVNQHGIMFGRGEVWMTGMCLDRHCRHFVPQVVTIQHTGG